MRRGNTRRHAVELLEQRVLFSTINVNTLADETIANSTTSLREAIAKDVSERNKVEVHPDEIIVTTGAKHAIYLALQCVVEPGDAILLPTPGWVSYVPMVELAGAQIIPLPLFEEDGFRVNVDRWKGLAIPPNVKGITRPSPLISEMFFLCDAT